MKVTWEVVSARPEGNMGYWPEKDQAAIELLRLLVERGRKLMAQRHRQGMVELLEADPPYPVVPTSSWEDLRHTQAFNYHRSGAYKARKARKHDEREAA